MQLSHYSSPAYTRLSRTWKDAVGKVGVIIELTTKESQGITYSIALVRINRKTMLLPVALGYEVNLRDRVVITLRRVFSRSTDTSNEIIPYHLAVKPEQSSLPFPNPSPTLPLSELESKKQINQEKLINQSEKSKPNVQKHPGGRVRQRE